MCKNGSVSLKERVTDAWEGYGLFAYSLPSTFCHGGDKFQKEMSKSGGKEHGGDG